MYSLHVDVDRQAIKGLIQSSQSIIANLDTVLGFSAWALEEQPLPVGVTGWCRTERRLWGFLSMLWRFAGSGYNVVCSYRSSNDLITSVKPEAFCLQVVCWSNYDSTLTDLCCLGKRVHAESIC